MNESGKGMKIGIISVNNAHNFGSSMQAYALITYLQSAGHSAQVINYRNPAIERSYMIVPKPRKSLKSMAKYSVKYVLKVIRKPYLLKRRERFESFFTGYLNLTKPVSTYRELCTAGYDFDAAFAGSDQIWNANIVKQIDPAFFLKFLEGKTICASYAASLGVEEITEPEREVYREYLKHLDYISVREESAKKLMQPLTDKEIAVISDPTVLLPAEEYQKLLLERPCDREYIYVHVHHYSAKAPELVQMAEMLSEQTGLPVIHNLQHHRFKNQAGRTVAAGPRETLTALYHAKYVVTQSFHMTMFSLIFHKDFITVRRDRYNTRLENLLGSVKMQDHMVQPGCLPDIRSLSRDDEAVDRYFVEERLKAQAFIDRVLSGHKQDRVPNYFVSGDPFTCYGCSACRDLCPVQAIEMEQDEEGFFRPVVQEGKCIHCGLCERSCIWGKGEKTPDKDRHGYYAFALDNETHVKSSSGGIATALGKHIIDQGGYVTGVRWSSTAEAVYDITDSYEGIEAFKYSKYIEPLHGDIYQKTKQALETGKPVLFIGLPCKVAGLKAFLRKEYDNLYTAELVCECSPSPLILPLHLRQKAKEAQSAVSAVRFREPEGWMERKTAYTYDNGRVEKVHYRDDLYFQCFVKRFLAKKSCYRCEFTRYKAGSDIVMGDFWGIRKRYPLKDFSKGVSCVITNSARGEELLNQVRDRIKAEAVPVRFILDNNASWPSAYNTRRVTLIRDILRDPDQAENLLRNARWNKKTGSENK